MPAEKAKQLVIFIALIAALTIICGFLLQASGVEALKLATFKGLKEAIPKLLSTPFIAFFILSAVIFALVNYLCLSKTKAFTYKTALPGLLVGIVISLLAFGFTTEKLFIAIFLLIGTLVLIETAFIKKQEFKKFISFRTSSSATQKAMLLIALGLFLSTAFTILNNQEKFVKEFEQEMLDMALGQAGGNQIADAAVEMNIQANKQAVGLITQTPQFNALRSKSDPEVQSFVNMMNSLESQIDTPAMKEAIKQQVLASQENAKSIVSFEMLRDKIPFLKTIEGFYWLIAGLGIAGVFLFFANLILANLAGLFTALLAVLLKKQGTN
jgi:hypothetical protein